MISLPGQSPRTCERLSRREWLTLGTLAATGMPCPAAHSADDQPRGFGRAKRGIVLFLFGGPAHQDTFDLKPHAPREVRGEFRPIATSLPDVTISEHLPLLSQRVHQFAQLRSVTHPDNTHTVAMHYMLTGVRHLRPATNPQNAADDFPCFGAVMNYLQRSRGERSPFPGGVSLNSPANQVSANNHIFPGFFAGSIGQGYDPLFVSQSPDQSNFQPFTAITPPQRMLDRDSLSRHLQKTPSDLANPVRDWERAYDRALGLLTSNAVHAAFDISQESPSLRERYGSTPFGQGCLLARRLSQAGVPLVTVNWQRDDAFWDTHADNFNLHKNKLLPNFDRGFSALLDDLSARGLLEETLVVVLSEFGRTPAINANAGRDHWAACNTVLLAGGGVPGGLIYGASDAVAAYPAKNPVSPADLAATMYHLLGVAAETPLPSPDGRRQVVSTGEVIHEIL